MRVMRMKPIYLFAMFVACAVAPIRSADACDCIGPGAACAAAWGAEAVFVGHVVSIDWSSIGRGRVQLAVLEPFRDLQLSQVTLVSEGSNCDYPFRMGESYLVYAHRMRDGQLSTSICARTRPVAEATEDLTYLRSLTTIAPGTPARVSGQVQLWEYPLPPGGALRQMSGVSVTATGGGRTVSARTNDRGQFELNGLVLGKYELVVTPPAGYQGAARTIDIHDPRPCGVQTLLVRYDGRVSGRVINGRGGGVAGLPIELVRRADLDREDGRVSRVQGWTLADGSYELRLVDPGNYVLGLNWIRPFNGRPTGPPVYFPGVTARADAATIAVSVGERVRLRDFMIPDSLRLVTVAGVVVDEAGRPVGEAQIYLRAEAPGPVIGPQFVTGADGRFAFTVRDGVRHDVHVTRYIGDEFGTTEVQTAIVPFTASSATPSITIVMRPNTR